MKKFTVLDALVAPLDRANVDTDQIIPKQFLKSIRRTGYGAYCFDSWRYLDVGAPGMDCAKRPLNPDFVLNQPRYRGAEILLARRNFGCGSSREHAIWALAEYGFRAILAPSFGDIFYSNGLKNGLLPVALAESEVDRLFQECFAQPGFRLTVDLERQTVSTSDGALVFRFDIAPAPKYALLHGLDEIGLTLRHAEKIRAYEAQRRAALPWMFRDAR
jgi:3-isopropylmalate/(R)-2-methylmalate dehydratase small subunit